MTKRNMDWRLCEPVTSAQKAAAADLDAAFDAWANSTPETRALDEALEQMGAAWERDEPFSDKHLCRHEPCICGGC